MKRKLTSRKFWALLASFVTGASLIIGGDTSTETISGAVMALGGVIAYILGESWVDASFNKSESEDAE